MTKSKIERIRKELLSEYGDRTLIIATDRNNGREVFRHTISTVGISCTADITEIKRILHEGRPRQVRITMPYDKQKNQ